MSPFRQQLAEDETKSEFWKIMCEQELAELEKTQKPDPGFYQRMVLGEWQTEKEKTT